MVWESRVRIKIYPLKQRCDGTGQLQAPCVKEDSFWKKSLLKHHGHVLGDGCGWLRKCLAHGQHLSGQTHILGYNTGPKRNYLMLFEIPHLIY